MKNEYKGKAKKTAQKTRTGLKETNLVTKEQSEIVRNITEIKANKERNLLNTASDKKTMLKTSSNRKLYGTNSPALTQRTDVKVGIATAKVGKTAIKAVGYVPKKAIGKIIKANETNEIKPKPHVNRGSEKIHVNDTKSSNKMLANAPKAPVDETGDKGKLNASKVNNQRKLRASVSASEKPNKLYVNTSVVTKSKESYVNSRKTQSKYADVQSNVHESKPNANVQNKIYVNKPKASVQSRAYVRVNNAQKPRRILLIERQKNKNISLVEQNKSNTPTINENKTVDVKSKAKKLQMIKRRHREALREKSEATQKTSDIKPIEKNEPTQAEQKQELINDKKKKHYEKLSQKWVQKQNKAEIKLDKAQNKLPTKREKTERVSVVENGAITYTNKREKVALSKAEYRKKVMKGSVPKRGVQMVTRLGGRQIHNAIAKEEHQVSNTGIEAARKGEQAVVRIGRVAKRARLSHKANKPYKMVEKSRNAYIRSTSKSNYYDALAKSLNTKYLQKKAIKNQYAKKARKEAGKKAGEATVKGVKAVGQVVVKTVKSVGTLIASHPVAALIIIGIIILIFVIMSLMQTATTVGISSLEGYANSSYLADMEDINSAELYFTELETDLKLILTPDGIAENYPGYDKYVINITDNELNKITHDPYELMAYLTAINSTFTFADIRAVIDELFTEMYTVTLTESSSYERDVEGNILYDEYGYPKTITTLQAELSAKDLKTAIKDKLDDEQKSIFDVLTDTKGNRYVVNNPLGETDWSNNISSSFGYRVHPITKEKNYHKGMDIPLPVNTRLLATHDGVVTAVGYEENGYGHYVSVTGSNGIETRYAHCKSISVEVGDEVKSGDIVALSGNSGQSTGSHLHFELIVNGTYVNPAYFTKFNQTKELGNEEN